MRIVSYNVNGLRARCKTGFNYSMIDLHADIICLQETKCTEAQGKACVKLRGFQMYFNNSKIKAGYSGTAIFTKVPPISITYGLSTLLDQEGRVIVAEYKHFYLVNCYTPNSNRGFERRAIWDEAFHEYVHKLHQSKPIVLCGDLNVISDTIDAYAPELVTNEGILGGYEVERTPFHNLLTQEHLIDSFRYLYPDKQDMYSWFRNYGDKKDNRGVRYDYFLVSDTLTSRIKDGYVDMRTYGSDHTPIVLDIVL